MNEKEIIDACHYDMNLPFDKLDVILKACLYLYEQIQTGKFTPMLSKNEPCDDETVDSILNTLNDIVSELVPQHDKMVSLLRHLPERNNYNKNI